MTDQILKFAFGGLSKVIFPVIKKLLTDKYKMKLMKKLRTSKTGRITCVLLCKKGGKTLMTDYISNLELKNVICIDLDSSGLKNSYDYENQLKLIGNDNYNILLLPEKIKIIRNLQNDFNKKSIVVLTSDHNLANYLNENEYEIITYLPNTTLYNSMYNILDEKEKQELFKSYNSILKMNTPYKNYSSLEELREMIKLLFI
jgi:hypothetical protein